jgi:putative endonuclease
MITKGGYVYIMTNQNNSVLYTGVTSNLKQRVYLHKTKLYPKSFTAKYNIDKLVYFEEHNSIENAIEKEKQIKGGSREKKIVLINNLNPEWKDLFDIINQ